ncbi:hypothetical protein [Vibrio porteresiae]|uniref:Lipoprotein n=1 Tax=Vibrio porteresiae DSM 19223 TaxID=1123496 RepID=A0ABZ0QG92_9VIBR|nr:hypothetical protein [Vibrio porteresiae]WPC75519.1 hypothetical protein R8Z52_21560 [Vibrio porteresiae DSM 19223]
MKKTMLLGAVLSSLLLTGCAQRVVDFTLASTKNVDLNNGKFIKGQRVQGTDTRPIILVPIGRPEIKEATDEAIEKDHCAVALTNVTADFSSFSLLFGYNRFTVEGDLIIDKNKPGCENWSM